MTVLGVGGRPGAEPDDLLALAAKAIAETGQSLTDLTTVATIDRRRDHPGVRRLIEAADCRLAVYDAATLAGQDVDHPSDTVAAHVGTPSVAEAAVRAASATPVSTLAADGWVVCVGEPGPDLRHHGDVEAAPGMLDFAVNVHAQEPPPFLASALRDAVADLARYPDPTAATAAVARAHGVPPDAVLLTHGAAEAFSLVAQQPWQHPVVVHPQFTEPEAALRAHGHAVHRLLLEPDTGFRLGGARPPSGADLVIIGNPTNPTSRLHDPDEIEALATDSPADERLVVVDEAFMDVVEDVAEPHHSLARRAAAGRHLVVIRSLTKTYSLAGLRVGYLIAHPDLIERLAARRNPWPVSSLAAVAAIACLSDEGREYAAKVRAELPGHLAHLAAGLHASGFTTVPNPRAPYLLARHADAARIREDLRGQGIAVRRADTFPGLDQTWLRLAARDRPTADRLLATIARR
ncbi:Rv2231c family pyridoxal phosphate-dependent protein CobC [Nocardioides speluncae]|uniref:Rv2231c family pyridoxal phosphate-dependent protein CobC n=1 Tax=Nocardioides speluncae TaxID=2670337 RepID=UPI000D6882D1|nr:Rv2231c family pyridoxal phosphate-dependent protein CobC [Nocardioides speluncae]